MRRQLPSLVAVGFVLVASLASRAALAQDAAPPSGEAPPPPLPAPQPAAQATPAQPATNVQAAPGSGGLTVVAPLAGGGSMTAVGCSAVTVAGHDTNVQPGGAPAAGPCPVTYVTPRPRYAPDGGRKAAIITAPIVYGLGMMISGVSYLTNKASCSWARSGDSDCTDARTSLIAYGTISAVVPSIPRFVVGDAARGVVYSAVRGGSIATAALVDWGKSDDAWMGPFLLGFGAPVALAIVDMATTPHREDLESKPDAAADHEHAEPAPPPRARITGVAPVALGDRENKPRGAGLSLSGTF